MAFPKKATYKKPHIFKTILLQKKLVYLNGGDQLLYETRQLLRLSGSLKELRMKSETIELDLPTRNCFRKEAVDILNGRLELCFLLRYSMLQPRSWRSCPGGPACKLTLEGQKPCFPI